jgi:PIN domain nuclease of toxin-antitoxin system
LIYLDTHVVAWLYSGLIEQLSHTARRLINDNDVFISPAVRLELQYLLEVKRIAAAPDTIVTDLANRIGLQVCAKPFNRIVSEALALAWTRDPFDRLITSHASLDSDILVSKDGNILRNYAHSRWA